MKYSYSYLNTQFFVHLVPVLTENWEEIFVQHVAAIVSILHSQRPYLCLVYRPNSLPSVYSLQFKEAFGIAFGLVGYLNLIISFLLSGCSSAIWLVQHIYSWSWFPRSYKISLFESFSCLSLRVIHLVSLFYFLRAW